MLLVQLIYWMLFENFYVNKIFVKKITSRFTKESRASEGKVTCDLAPCPWNSPSSLDGFSCLPPGGLRENSDSA